MDLQQESSGSGLPLDHEEPLATAPPTSSQMRDAARDIILGSFAGAAGKIIEYPFDTVKVRLQSQAAGQPLQYTGPLDCFRQSIAKDGLYRGLYRGVSAPTVGAAIETSSLFLSYNVAQTALKKTVYGSGQPLPLGALCVAGAASGAFTSLVLTPIELVKCRVQVFAETPGYAKPGLGAVIGSVLKENGILGFWRGQLGTLIRETGGSAAWFGVYEGASAFFKARNAKRHHNQAHDDVGTPTTVGQQLLSGAAAGMSYNFAFYPADTIKSRMQTEVVTSGASGLTFWGTGKALWKDHGLRGMYRGCGITLLRSAPSSAIIFTIYASLKDTFP